MSAGGGHGRHRLAPPGGAWWLVVLALAGGCAIRKPAPPAAPAAQGPVPPVVTPEREPARAPVEPPVDTVALTGLVSADTPPERVAAIGLVEDARLALERGDLEAAMELAERSLAVDPSVPYGYYFLGRAALRAGRPRDTLGFAQRAAALLGDDPRWRGAVYALEGAAYEALGRVARARSAYLRCLALAPGNLSARAGAARLSHAR